MKQSNSLGVCNRLVRLFTTYLHVDFNYFRDLPRGIPYGWLPSKNNDAELLTG